jgi:hypothetical protein
MKLYCRDDVEILRRSVMTFRDLLIKTTETRYEDPQTGEMGVVPGIDPTDYVTVASVCMGVFKRKFLKAYRHVKVSDGESTSPWLPTKEEDGHVMVRFKDEWMPLDTLTILEDETLPSPIKLVPSEGYVRKKTIFQDIHTVVRVVESHPGH